MPRPRANGENLLGLIIFFFLRFLRTILILSRINDILEKQFKHTNRQTQKEENSLEQHPPKEVGLRLHSMKAKTKSVIQVLIIFRG